MELDQMGEKSIGLGNVLGKNLKKHATFLIRDGLKIARLAFVDVSAVEFMTEDATNAEEWGPSTTTMASISDAAYRSEDYMRIVQVLHNRTALTGKRYWRQIQKALTLLEYLLLHGPDQMVMEFRTDKDRIEELTRFVFVDEQLVDRGAVLQKKAYQVLKLLMEEKYYKEERRRAQKISKGIHGFGSLSPCIKSTTSKLCSEDSSKTRTDTNSAEITFQKSYTHPGTTVSTPVKVDMGREQNVVGMVNLKSDSEASSPTSVQSSCNSSWSSFSNITAGDTPQTNSASSSASTELNPFDESPTSALSFPSSTSPNAGGWTPKAFAPKNMEVSPRALDSCRQRPSIPPLFKLPPPPPPPPYKCTSAPWGCSRRRSQPLVAQGVPDLIDMSEDIPSIQSS